MYSLVTTSIIQGIKSIPVYVEADVSDGMPLFEMVGSLSPEVKESKERVRTALKNTGYILPPKRITINFIPANIRNDMYITAVNFMSLNSSAISAIPAVLDAPNVCDPTACATVEVICKVPDVCAAILSKPTLMNDII